QGQRGTTAANSRCESWAGEISMDSVLFRTVARLSAARSHCLLGQSVAILTTLAAIAVRYWVGDIFVGFPFLTFFPAIVLSTFIGGRSAGITAAVLGGLLADYYLIAPTPSFALEWPAGWVAMGFYTLTSV